MPVPGFQRMLLPLLSLCADGQEHTLSDAYQALAAEFGLTAEERGVLLPSGKQTQFENRVQWAKCHLVKAAVLDPTGRARFRITPRGHTLLAGNPVELSIGVLLQFPEFQAFRMKSSSSIAADDATVAAANEDQTPREILEASYRELRRTLASDLLDKIMAQPPVFFEQLVIDLLIAMGYGGSRRDAGQAIGRSGDGGVDGLIKEDRLGLDVLYVQAKRWKDPVGRPEVQAFAGSLMGCKARKGVFITTSRFSDAAHTYTNSIQERNIVLIDGEQLAQLMIDHNIGVAEVDRYVIKQVDTDYFEAGP